MMGRQCDDQASLFYKFRLEDRVPGDHLLRKIDRFLDLDNLNDFCDSVDLILHRLELDQDERHKMPRTRDFPFGGIDLIRRWKNTGMSP